MLSNLQSIKALSPSGLHVCVGCGNSTMSSNLHFSGFKKVTNIDYSENVIERMKKKYSELEEMKWYTMDILEMKFSSGSFDTVSF